jgi:membrane-associated protease RseP (regulator of RpoE activity)
MVLETIATQEPLTIDALVRRVFSISEVTLGSRSLGFITRYRGELVSSDSAQAYETLSADLHPLGCLPLFREENGVQTILIIPARPAAKPSRLWINILLFVVTIFSVLFAGMTYVTGDQLPNTTAGILAALWTGGIPYMVSLLAILGTHEMGHYLVSRRHKVEATLPYFIPMPIGLGTMGAFINMKGIPRNRNHLMDIGAAGPLAGFVVAIVVLIIGLRMSVIDTIPVSFPTGYGAQIEGNSILYLLFKYLSFGMLLPHPAAYTMSPLLYWLRYFFTGQPAPFGATDVMLSPVAWAGWVGILVTSLNLIPAGTLDGGHIAQTLFGKRTTRLFLPFILGILVLLGMVWNGWLLWAAMIFFLVGRVYAEPLDQITPLSKSRKVIGVLCIILFLLTFTPVPFNLIS